MVLSNSGLLKYSQQDLWDAFWERRNAKRIDSWAKRRISSVLSGYARSGISVLDAGCGSGYFSSYFISCGCYVYSMDYSDKALEITKEITGHKSRAYIKGDVLDERLLIGERFDVIFTDGLLEHYSKERQDRLITNMKRLKKDKGYMINFVPNRASTWNLARPFYINIKERPFAMGEFIDLHKRNGLDIVLHGGVNVLPFRVSPERLLGRYIGMLFYCIAQ